MTVGFPGYFPERLWGLCLKNMGHHQWSFKKKKNTDTSLDMMTLISLGFSLPLE